MVLEQKRVLIVSHDVVGKRMAGPGIRYYHLAQALARHFSVTLATPGPDSQLDPHGFDMMPYADPNSESLASRVRDSDVVVVAAIWVTAILPHLSPSICVAVDGYDPFVAETLSLGAEDVAGLERTLTQAYLVGDFFMCASERQRDWWLGILEANGRINVHTFEEDRALRQLLDVVPYGLPDKEPMHSESTFRWPGIGPDDKVILWGGGLWRWLDPLTAIRAVAKIWQQRRDIRLVFPGTEHPNPEMKGISTHRAAARELAREEDLLDKAVFFGEWIPYENWPSMLLRSDVALTLHYDTLETRLAFRSRVLDYIWAGLPTVATRGDATSDLIADYDLGTVVDYEDVEGVARAILHLLDSFSGNLRGRFTEARQALTWERAAEPLVEFCRHPRRAPDKVALGDDLGNPFYVERRRHLVGERDQWRELAKRYEQGRFMRLMRMLRRFKEQIPCV